MAFNAKVCKPDRNLREVNFVTSPVKPSSAIVKANDIIASSVANHSRNVERGLYTKLGPAQAIPSYDTIANVSAVTRENEWSI